VTARGDNEARQVEMGRLTTRLTVFSKHWKNKNMEQQWDSTSVTYTSQGTHCFCWKGSAVSRRDWYHSGVKNVKSKAIPVTDLGGV
jgi:hypothetical protein